MDARQYVLELQALLRDAAWPDGTQEAVLGDRVHVVTAGLEEEEIPAPPFAFLHVGESTSDPRIPTLKNQDFHLVVVLPAMNDRLGSAAITGGPRGGSVLGSTRGRGIIEVSRALLASVRHLTGADGLPIQCHLGSGARARGLGDSRALVAQEHVLKAMVTEDPEWLPPPWFTATKNGSSVDLAWALPPSVAAFRRVHIRYALGSTAPATVSDGSQAYLGSATSASHTPVAFPVSYSIFAAYTETGAAEDQAHSSHELWTRRTVTS